MSKRFKVLTKNELERLITIELKAFELMQDIQERLEKIGLTGEQILEIIDSDFEYMSGISMSAQEDEKQITYLLDDGKIERVKEVRK